MRRLLFGILLFNVGLLASLPGNAQEKTTPTQPIGRAGLTTRTFHPTAARNWRGSDTHELRCTIWYPAIDTAAEVPQFIGPPGAPLFDAGFASPRADWAPSLSKLPLIVLSHGTGGSALQLAWFGTALARAGYIAVAVDHPGNNATEPLTPEGFVLWWERATDISNVLDGLLADPDLAHRIDTTRIGAAGFSLGGYTVLELAGARTDISILYDLCRQHADTPACHVPEMRSLPPDIANPEAILQKVRRTSGESLARAADSFLDPRIRAVFAIAPALGFTQTQESIRSIRVPVEIVVGNADPIAPAADNADYLRSNIKSARETVIPNGVAHYTFLDTCAAAGKSTLSTYCADAPGVDRNAVHAEAATLAFTFFNRALRPAKGH